MKGTATLICGGLRVLIEFPDGMTMELPVPLMGEPVANQLCSVCGMPFHMARGLKRTERPYCKDAACQRERAARNKRAQRKAKAVDA